MCTSHDSHLAVSFKWKWKIVSDICFRELSNSAAYTVSEPRPNQIPQESRSPSGEAPLNTVQGNYVWQKPSACGGRSIDLWLCLTADIVPYWCPCPGSWVCIQLNHLRDRHQSLSLMWHPCKERGGVSPSEWKRETDRQKQAERQRQRDVCQAEKAATDPVKRTRLLFN